MPKISTHTFVVWLGAERKGYSIAINYNTYVEGFYAKLPEEFKAAAESLTAEKRNELKITSEKTKKGYNSPYEWIVKSKVESGVGYAVEDAINYLSTLKVTEEKVILITYNPETTHHTDYKVYNYQHRPIGLKLGICYATKKGIPGGKPEYTVEGTGATFNPSYYDAKMEIPDTPEARENLEKIYTALAALTGKLNQYLKSPESIINLIESMSVVGSANLLGAGPAQIDNQ